MANDSQDSDSGQESQVYGSLKQALDNHRGERHVVVLQEYPDPDAISSAFAHQLIGHEYEIGVDILHGGRVSHQENLALINLLDIKLNRYRSPSDLGEYQAAVFVDNQGATARDIVEQLEAQSVPTLAVIDHHEPDEILRPMFADIRPVGATATIYAEYLQDGILQLRDSEDDHVRVATAMMHGLMSDTGRFTRAGPQDFKAAAYLTEFRDLGLLEQILSQARSRQTMNAIQLALAKRETIESFSIAGVGYLRAEDRDSIPQAADFLATEENVHTAIVFGIVRGDERADESLIGSLRTTKVTLDPDDFIKEVFGKSEEGDYFGGGRTSAGAFEIPIEFLAGESDGDYEEMKWQVYESQIKRKLFQKIGVEREADQAES